MKSLYHTLPRTVVQLAAVLVALLGTIQPAAATDVDPFYSNRAPNAPTLLSPASGARLALNSLQPTLQLRWRNNGDPEGDRVSFYVDTMYFDVYSRTWKPAVKQTVYTTSCPVQFKGSPGSSVHLAWRVFAMDATRRSRPWYSVTGWSVFQVSFPSTRTTATPATTTVPATTAPRTGFDFGNKWKVYAHHAGNGIWTRITNSPNTFRADWKGHDGKHYTTVVTMTFNNGRIDAVSKFADGKAHFHFFTDSLDPNLEVARRMTSIPRNRQYGGQQHTGYGNGYVATYTVIE